MRMNSVTGRCDLPEGQECYYCEAAFRHSGMDIMGQYGASIVVLHGHKEATSACVGGLMHMRAPGPRAHSANSTMHDRCAALEL